MCGPLGLQLSFRTEDFLSITCPSCVCLALFSTKYLILGLGWEGVLQTFVIQSHWSTAPILSSEAWLTGAPSSRLGYREGGRPQF